MAADPGTIEDGDAVVSTTSRGDRAIENHPCLCGTDFGKFDRPPSASHLCRHVAVRRRPAIAKRFLVSPPAISNTSGEMVQQRPASASLPAPENQNSARHLRWNGNPLRQVRGETYLGKSPAMSYPFEQRPWMKAAEIADAMIAAIKSSQYRCCAVTSPTATWSTARQQFRRGAYCIEGRRLSLGRLLKPSIRRWCRADHLRPWPPIKCLNWTETRAAEP